MEKEITPGVFLSVITKEKWLQRTAILEGEDLRFFVERCNKAYSTEIVLNHVLGITSDEFHKCLKEIEPDINLKDDFYVIRLSPGPGMVST